MYVYMIYGFSILHVHQNYSHKNNTKAAHMWQNNADQHKIAE